MDLPKERNEEKNPLCHPPHMGPSRFARPRRWDTGSNQIACRKASGALLAGQETSRKRIDSGFPGPLR